MLASEVIEKLQELIQKHGNVLVVMDDDSTPSIDYNEDGDPAFVIS